MNPTPRKPAKARLAKARVVPCRTHYLTHPDRKCYYEARVPTSTRREAREICRLHGMSEGELERLVRNAVFRVRGAPQTDYQLRVADAVLAALNLRGAR